MIRATHLSTAMVLLEIGGFRLLTDPTLDPLGTRYRFGPFARSSKTEATAWPVERLLDGGPIDAVLVSHHHHTDNLDYLGRELLERGEVGRVVTHDRWPEDLATLSEADLARVVANPAGQALGPGRWTRRLRLEDKLVAISEFGSHRLERATEWIDVTCVPALHGRYENWRWLRGVAPKLFDRRSVGFLLEWSGRPGQLLYLSGDTINFEGIGRIERYVRDHDKRIDVAFMHGGCVGFPVLDALGFGPHTFDGPGMVDAARTLHPRLIVPVHYDGWEHFRERRSSLASALSESEFADRTQWLVKGLPTNLGSE